jgi:flagellar protein FliO/FliZ
LFVILVLAVSAGAQNTDRLNSQTEDINSRPLETEIILFDSPVAPGEDAPPAAELPGVGFGDFLRVILVLGVVIVLIYAFVWLLRKFSGVKVEGSDIIHLLSTRPLKGDSALHLVEIGSRVFLVGSSSGSVNLISEIDDQESIDDIRLNAAKVPAAVSGGFAKLFRDKFSSGPVAFRKPPQTGGEREKKDSPDPTSFLRKQRERLKGL